MCIVLSNYRKICPENALYRPTIHTSSSFCLGNVPMNLESTYLSNYHPVYTFVLSIRYIKLMFYKAYYLVSS